MFFPKQSKAKAQLPHPDKKKKKKKGLDDKYHPKAEFFTATKFLRHLKACNEVVTSQKAKIKIKTTPLRMQDQPQIHRCRDQSQAYHRYPVE